MELTSFNFLIFFPILIILYYLSPSKHRWKLLLVSSYFFYINLMPVFVILLAGVTLSTFLFTRLIDNTDQESKKVSLMRLNIILILVPLFFFKYFEAINEGMIAFFESTGLRWPLPPIKLFLPIGISFYTFVAIGYTVDVYNEEIKAEKNLGILALFISFFPLVMSGPIERANNMLPQFNSKLKFNYQNLVSGMRLLLWGYFMKLVIAERIGLYVNVIFENYELHNGSTLMFAYLLYPFQMYADLGGYSLIAIGTSKILGLNVMHNFKRPFFARSVSEFWRRWHISFITWITDYIYTPLSFTFRRYKTNGIILALMITFIISGIWHGATFTFLVWGFIHGVYLSIEVLTSKIKANTENKYQLNKRGWYILLGIIITFILFALSQIVGRASNLEESYITISKIFTSSGSIFEFKSSDFYYSVLGVLIILVKEFIEEFFPERIRIFESNLKIVRVTAYSMTIIIILLIGVFDGGQFIYLQF